MIEPDAPLADLGEPKAFNLADFKEKYWGKLKHELLAAFGPHNRSRRA
jgi:hypothetical protein